MSRPSLNPLMPEGISALAPARSTSSFGEVRSTERGKLGRATFCSDRPDIPRDGDQEEVLVTFPEDEAQALPGESPFPVVRPNMQLDDDAIRHGFMAVVDLVPTLARLVIEHLVRLAVIRRPDELVEVAIAGNLDGIAAAVPGAP